MRFQDHHRFFFPLLFVDEHNTSFQLKHQTAPSVTTATKMAQRKHSHFCKLQNVRSGESPPPLLLRLSL